MRTELVILILLSALILLVAGLFFYMVKKLARLREENEKMQRDSEETVLQYVEQAVQAMEGRLGSNANQSALLLQNALQDIGTNQSMRFEAMGGRMDASLSAQDGRIRHLADVLDTRLNANDGKVERLRETLYEGIQKLQQQNAQKLEEMRVTVDEKLHSTLNRRLGESFSLVNERLQQVYQGLGEMKTLATGVGDLKKVLTNVKTRGVWGETQLGTLLAETLTATQYEQNVQVKAGSQERVEFAVRLPGSDSAIYLPIDAKFPVESYFRLQEASERGDKAEADAVLAQLLSAIDREARRIADKYIVPGATTDFALMYLPLESLYAEVLRAPDAAQKIQREQHVVIVGPSTLQALLNSLQMGFRTLAIEQRSHDVWRLLGAVKADFIQFGEILDKTQQRLRQASDTIELAGKKTRVIERRLRQVEGIEERTENLSAGAQDAPDEPA